MEKIEEKMNLPTLSIRDWEDIIYEAIKKAKINNYHVSKLLIPLNIQKDLFDKMINFGKEYKKEFSPMVTIFGIPVKISDKLEIVITLWE